MSIQNDPKILYAKMEESSGGTIRFAGEIQSLLQASLPRHADALYDVAFRAKFLVRTWKILQRLPPRDEAREQLKMTFQSELDAVKNTILTFVDSFPPEISVHFKEQFFSSTVQSLQVLMDLLHDLSWIQNVKLDDESVS